MPRIKSCLALSDVNEASSSISADVMCNDVQVSMDVLARKKLGFTVKKQVDSTGRIGFNMKVPERDSPTTTMKLFVADQDSRSATSESDF